MSIEIEPQVALPNVSLVETDGVPLESHWHVLQIGLLIELLAYWFRDRNDYYASGNMFIYFSEEQARNREYRGPDFFYVDGASRLPLRPYWAVWQEGGRYPDVITQRMLKAALAGAPAAYSIPELDALARHCTEQEDDANRIERQVRKSAAALLLEGRIGERFQGIVTGASEKGTWVRTCRYPVEGRLARGHEDLDVGDRVRVKLITVNVERGFIDFAC